MLQMVNVDNVSYLAVKPYFMTILEATSVVINNKRLKKLAPPICINTSQSGSSKLMMVITETTLNLIEYYNQYYNTFVHTYS